jgi:excinuclease ABC subunit A
MPRITTLSLEAQTVSQMVDQVLALPEGSKILVLAPMISERKGEHLHVFQELKSQGFIRVRVDGLVIDLDEAPQLDKKKKHSIDAVVDRLKSMIRNAFASLNRLKQD